MAALVLGTAEAGATGNQLPPTMADALSESAQAWALAQMSTGPAEPTIFLPIDARLAKARCPAGWRFDLPFADPQAVRARCASPMLQAFLRSTVPLRDAGRLTVGGRIGAAATAGSLVEPSHDRIAPDRPRPAVGAPLHSQQAQSAKPRQILTLRQGLRRGMPIEPHHLDTVATDAPPRRGLGSPVEDLAAIEHMELARDKAAGEWLYAQDLVPVLMVRKGQLISVTKKGVPGLMITVQLEALQDGRYGQVVRLRNRDSGRVVSGVISGPNAAQLP